MPIIADRSSGSSSDQDLTLIDTKSFKSISSENANNYRTAYKSQFNLTPLTQLFYKVKSDDKMTESSQKQQFQAAAAYQPQHLMMKNDEPRDEYFPLSPISNMFQQ